MTAQQLRQQAAALRIRARTIIIFHAWRFSVQARELEAQANAIEAREKATA